MTPHTARLRRLAIMSLSLAAGLAAPAAFVAVVSGSIHFALSGFILAALTILPFFVYSLFWAFRYPGGTIHPTIRPKDLAVHAIVVIAPMLPACAGLGLLESKSYGQAALAFLVYAALGMGGLSLVHRSNLARRRAAIQAGAQPQPPDEESRREVTRFNRLVILSALAVFPTLYLTVRGHYLPGILVGWCSISIALYATYRFSKYLGKKGAA